MIRGHWEQKTRNSLSLYQSGTSSDARCLLLSFAITNTTLRAASCV